MSIFYNVESSTIKNYLYRKPILQVDGSGELGSYHHEANKSKVIKKLALLNIVGYNDKGVLVSFEPIAEVNQYLMSKAIDDGVLETTTTSQGLAHYFHFLIGLQADWDAEYKDNDFDPVYDDPRPEWNTFPKLKQDRATYLYRNGLKELFLTGQIARTTANSYISSVVGFYKYWLRRGYKFNNPPFTFETISLKLEGSSSSMKAFTTKDIQTTDLRLKLSKSSRSDGTALGNVRRDLRPFTPSEWKILQNILMKSRRVVRNRDASKLHSLPIEFCLHAMICRYTGMRREEAASLHCGQIVNPETCINDKKQIDFKKPILKIGIGDKYNSLTKTKEAGNKPRITIIPSVIMKDLYNYTQSERYKKRLVKFKAWCAEENKAGNHALFEGDDAVKPNLDYLFITQTGRPMFTRPSDFTGRWVEVRDTANLSKALDHEILGSLHNLRSTFAVHVLKHLLNHLEPDVALDRVCALLGHENRKTTMEYLKIAQDMPTGDEIYEDVLVYIGIFDDTLDDGHQG